MGLFGLGGLGPKTGYELFELGDSLRLTVGQFALQTLPFRLLTLERTPSACVALQLLMFDVQDGGGEGIDKVAVMGNDDNRAIKPQ